MKNSEAELRGRIHSLESFGAVDGPGIRFVIFFQGCPLRCIYCHNPDTWPMKAGREMTVAQLVETVRPYRPFLRRGGVTLTGGEPLAQSEFALALTRAFQREGMSVAVDTAGSIPLSRCGAVVDEADLLLLDIKALDGALCTMLCGSDGASAKAVLARREEIGKPVWLRHVVVPDYTLKDAALSALANYLRDFSCIERVELLPFHQMGSYKWAAENLHYALQDKRTPTEEEMARARKIFSDAGLTVQ